MVGRSDGRVLLVDPNGSSVELGLRMVSVICPQMSPYGFG